MTVPVELEPGECDGPSGGGARRSKAPSRAGPWVRSRGPASSATRSPLTGGFIIIFLVIVAICAPFIVNGSATRRTSSTRTSSTPTCSPHRPLRRHRRDFLFGVEPVNGRDLFSRILYGARISLLVAFLATTLSVIIGTFMGIMAGYFGGWIDTLISRLMDIFLAFPLLLFAIALGA